MPELPIKRDTIPGIGVEIWFVPTQTGTFEIACAEILASATCSLDMWGFSTRSEEKSCILLTARSLRGRKCPGW